MNAALLAKMKPGTIFINTARGEVVDHGALAAAVKDRGIRVGLDVYANEPAAATAPFTDDLVGVAGCLRHASHRRLDRSGAGSDRGGDGPHHPQLQGDRPRAERGEPGAAARPATHMLVVRHRDRPGVLAHVFNHLRQAHLNVQETENIVFEGAEAAVARINLDGAALGRPVLPDQNRER